MKPVHKLFRAHFSRGNKTPSRALTDAEPLSVSPEDLEADLRRYFNYTLGRDRYCVSDHYTYEALVLTLRDRLMERWRNTRYAYREARCKRTHYISMEFLMGRALHNAILNLAIERETTEALRRLDVVLDDIAEMEHDAGLGNGGLGRLAACFLDSCATLQLPVSGYGIRYQYGMFHQHIEDGYQVEEPDQWLRDGNPWEIERPEYTRRIQFEGRSETVLGDDGVWRHRWVETRDVLAIPYDTPIPGFRNGTVNTLRLWTAAATDEFDLNEFNAGDYSEAVAAKNAAENITMVLYPNDASENGKVLRLRQQYFLASASLQDVLGHWVDQNGEDFSRFAEKNCFQLNDTHPAVAVAELMRLLVDRYRLEWDQAWAITQKTMAYTNHTLLPEALEKWPVWMFRQILPRLLDIIFEINARFLAEVSRKWPWDGERLQRMSIIEEGHEQQVRMAHLAIVGSFSVNGVAELHSNLLKNGLFRDFYELWPERFNNKTNGVTQRRWLALANPPLAALLSECLGEGWLTDLGQIRGIARYAGDAAFCQRWREIKKANKVRLAQWVAKDCAVTFDTEALFDVQVKRIHEYKRQLLNILHVIHLYDRIKSGDTRDWTPRCVLFGGKAAPGYAAAKKIIKLVCNVAEVINKDPQIGDYLKVAFLPNYRVTAMEVVCPGTDLSEQISTAGKEASGTGNMKFMMNGAITIGTLDGANIEIREEVGDQNFFLFGLTAEQVIQTRHHYDPLAIIDQDEELRRVFDLLESGHFCRFEHGIFDDLIAAVKSPHDPWLILADFRSYVEAQRHAAAAYRDPQRWTQMSIANTAASGRFSTDRTIRQYNDEIWRMQAVPAKPVPGSC